MKMFADLLQHSIGKITLSIRVGVLGGYQYLVDMKSLASILRNLDSVDLIIHICLFGAICLAKHRKVEATINRYQHYFYNSMFNIVIYTPPSVLKT